MPDLAIKGVSWPRRLFAAGLVVAPLSACADLPRDAPRSDVIRDAAVQRVDAPGEHVPYVLVNLGPSMVQTVNAGANGSSDLEALARMPPRRAAADAPVVVGDILNLTIFESQAGGLFIPSEAGSRAGNFISLPNQQVDAQGFINVPYAGALKVSGLTAREIAATVADKLKQRAIEPQVVVSIAERRGDEVSVIGEVTTPTRFPLDPGGLRVSGAVARAGGTKYPDYDIAFALERGGHTYHSTLSTILSNSRYDIQVQPRDVLYLTHDPRFVSVFGGTLDPTLTNISRRVMFESRTMSLAEAVAKAGGLNTARADARAVFVLRLEQRRVLDRVGVNTAHYTGDLVPTVYSVNLATADGFFISDQLQLRTHDIIIVSEAPYTDFVKFFSLFNLIAQVPSDAGSIAASAAVR